MTAADEARSPTSSSMEEVAAKRPEEVCALPVKKKPHEATPQKLRASPPQSALRADSSSIEEEQGAKSWLRRRAKQMRAEMTPHEKTMWRLLHQGELVALNWRKQAPFGDFILDFVSHPARLVIEVDGSQHAEPAQAAHDAERSEWLRSEGYQVLRFWNNEAIRARDDVWRSIQCAALATPAAPRMLRWRASDLARVQRANAPTSSSMEEVAAKRPEEVRAPPVKKEPPEATPQDLRASPPQSALRADSSSIEEEQG